MQVFNFKDDFNTVMEQAKALQEQSANQGQFTQPVQPQGQFAQPTQGQFTQPAQGQFTQPVQPTQGQFTQPVQPQGQFAQPTQGQVTQPTQSEQPANTTQSFQVDVFGSNDVPQTHQQGFPTSVVPEPVQEPVQEPIKEPVQEPIKEQVQEPVEEPTVKEVKETKTKTKKARKTAKKATKEEIQADAPIDTKDVVNHILDDATVKEIKDQLYSAVYDLSVDVIKKAMVDAAVAAAKDLRG